MAIIDLDEDARVDAASGEQHPELGFRIGITDQDQMLADPITGASVEPDQLDVPPARGGPAPAHIRDLPGGGQSDTYKIINPEPAGGHGASVLASQWIRRPSRSGTANAAHTILPPERIGAQPHSW